MRALGKLHFWIMTPAFWMMSIGQMSVGVMGMRRRIADYDPKLGGVTANGLSAVEVGQTVITISAFLIAFSILLMIYNLFNSAEMGAIAGNNPWNSRSPEWQIPSPVPEHSYRYPHHGGGRTLRLRSAGLNLRDDGCAGDDNSHNCDVMQRPYDIAVRVLRRQARH